MTIRTHYLSPKRAATWILLAASLGSVPAFGQEIIRWVDDEGVTHFGHPATANQKVIRVEPEADAQALLVDELGDVAETVVTANESRPNPTQQSPTQKL